MKLELRSTPALTNYRDYDVRVRAVTSVGAGPWTGAVTGKPARQQTVWSATLTSKNLATGSRRGCKAGSGADACATALSDNAFTAEGTDYTVSSVDVFRFKGVEDLNALDLNLLTDADQSPLVEGYTLVVGGLQYSMAEGVSRYTRGTATWGFVGQTWADWTPGDEVELSLQKELTVPDAPTNLSLTAGDGQLSASWAAPAEVGGSAISRYELEYRETPVAGQTNTAWRSAAHSGAGVTARITGLTNLDVYDVRVRAVNAQGSSDWSDVATDTPLPPGTIWAAKLTAQDTLVGLQFGCDTTALCENALTDDEFTLEEVEYRVDVIDNDGSELAITFNRATPDALQTYMLLVGDAQFPFAGASGSRIRPVWTDSVPSWTAGQVVQLQIRLGNIPTGLTLAAGDGKLDASWKAPFDPDFGVTGYDVQYKRSAASSWADVGHSGVGTEQAISGLTNYRKYDVRVRANNADGAGDWSRVATGVPLRPGQVWVWDADLSVGDVTFGAGCGTPQTSTTTKRGCSGRLSDTTVDNYRGETYTVQYVNLRSVWPYTDAEGRSILRFALDRPFARGGGGFLTLMVNGRPFAWEAGDDSGLPPQLQRGRVLLRGRGQELVRAWPGLGPGPDRRAGPGLHAHGVVRELRGLHHPLRRGHAGDAVLARVARLPGPVDPGHLGAAQRTRPPPAG